MIRNDGDAGAFPLAHRHSRHAYRALAGRLRGVGMACRSSSRSCCWASRSGFACNSRRARLPENEGRRRDIEEGAARGIPFGRWSNLKIVIIALFGAVAGQAVVWYTGQFYALFFLERMVKVDGLTANTLVAIALLIATPFFVFFGWLSDKIGRKPIILAGCLLAALTCSRSSTH